MVSAGTLLMAMYGQGKTRGQVGILGLDAAINQACAAICLNGDADNVYIFQLLLKNYSRIRAMSNTGGQENLSATLIKQIPIILHPLPEQKAIADILETWDRAIEKTERLIDAKQKRFNALMQKLIVDNGKLKQSKDGWKIVKLGSFLDESRILGENGLKAKKLTVKLYGKGVVPKVEKQAGSSSTQYYIRKAGQFIYSKLDFLNGAFGIVPNKLDSFESTLDLPAFDIDKNKVFKDWFLFYLIRPEYYTRQLGLARGQRKARRVNPTDFLNSTILLPPLEKQQKIAETLNAAQKEIDLLKKLVEKYKTQKRGLMQKLLTGEWRVNGVMSDEL